MEASEILWYKETIGPEVVRTLHDLRQHADSRIMPNLAK